MATRRGEDRDRGDHRRNADREDARAPRDNVRAARDDRRPPGDEPRGARIPGLGEYFLSGDGIDRQVLQVELCKFLGSEATARPGEYNGQRGYLIRAVRPFTPAMVRSLKESSREYRSEVRDLRVQDYEVPYQDSGTYRDAESRRRQDPNSMLVDDSYQPGSSRIVPGGLYSSGSEYPSRTVTAPSALYSTAGSYPSRPGYPSTQDGYPVTSMPGTYMNDPSYTYGPTGEYVAMGGSHQPQQYMQSGYGYTGQAPSGATGRGTSDDRYQYYDQTTGQPLSVTSAGYAQPSSAVRTDPRTMPGFDPRSQPGYDPRSSPGYDPRTQPGYDPRAQPGYIDPRYEDPRAGRAPPEPSSRQRTRDDDRRRHRG